MNYARKFLCFLFLFVFVSDRKGGGAEGIAVLCILELRLLTPYRPSFLAVSLSRN
jgi:hypothetical protein